MSLVETSRQRDPRPSFEAFWRRARQVRVHYHHGGATQETTALRESPLVKLKLIQRRIHDLRTPSSLRCARSLARQDLLPPSQKQELN